MLALLGCGIENPEEPSRRGQEASSAAPPASAPVFSQFDPDKNRHNEELVSKLSSDLRQNPPPGFSAIWIEHEPAFAVMLAFKEPPDREAILARADPDLRPHIVFRSASRSQAEIERDLDRVIEAMRGSPAEWAGGYDVKTGKFVYDVASPEGVAFAQKRLPPDLRDDVTFRLGSVPQPLAR